MDKLVDGISKVTISKEDLKTLLKDRSLDRATICLTCGEFFVGDPSKHKSSTSHHLYFQGGSFKCVKCGHDFNNDNCGEDLKRMRSKLESAYGQRLIKEAAGNVASNIAGRIGNAFK